MQTQSFIDAHEMHDAFLGNKLGRLVDLIAEQGDALIQDAGLSFPSRASSTILLVSERGDISAADVARELQQPHQLASQRIEALINLGLMKRKDDPGDARRKTLTLTAKGKREAAVLKKVLADVQGAFEGVYKEISVDLSDIVIRAMDALNKAPLSERVAGAKRKPKKTKHVQKHQAGRRLSYG